ncbi:MAG: response regulator [Kiritimatiellaeota bacterium]|nr:response regulator [Kiritimatiellota bacterium]
MAYILIVEDDQDYADAVSTVLSAENHEIRILRETHTVIGSMQERRPDLVILDIMFPEDVSAGFRLARAIHNFHSELEDVPILLLTAVNARFPLGFGPGDIDEVWMPATDFLEKPVDFDLLRDKVNALLRDRAGARHADRDLTVESRRTGNP